MAIYFCEHCEYYREVSQEHVGKKAKCPHCTKISTVIDTLELIQQLASDIIDNRQETKKENVSINLSALNISDTKEFAKSSNIIPIKQWFSEKQINTAIDESALDTTGFFDEVAEMIGNNYEVLRHVTNQIKFIQNKGYENVKITLANKDDKERNQIIDFCRKLYEYSFVAKYFYDKKEKAIRLLIQPSNVIRSFFNGEWLEWYVFIVLIRTFKVKNIPISIVRQLRIKLPNKQEFELDVFLLVNNKVPILIECKSGEFRREIQKYADLKKKLNIDASAFFLLSIDLTEDQCKGLSTMYDLTFINIENCVSNILTSIEQ